jgi:PAS domain S-box-containing protein
MNIDYEEVSTPDTACAPPNWAAHGAAPEKTALPRTDQQQLEQLRAALRASEDRYRWLMRASAQAVITADASGANTDSGSDWWEQITGQPMSESRNHGWTKRLHPDDYESTVVVWRQALAAQTPFEAEFRVKRRDGSYCWMQATGTPARNTDGSFREWIIALRDISERKQAEAVLRENQERAQARAEELEALMKAVPAIVFIAHDPECLRISGSQLAHEILRMPPEANLSKSAPVDERPTHFKVFKGGVELQPEELPMQLAARGLEVSDFEEEIIFDDGEHRSLYGHAMPLRDSQGKVRGAISAFVDITERKQVELALRESEERFAKAFQASPHLMTISTLEGGRYLAVNDAVLRATGYTREEMVGHTSAELNIFDHPEGRDRLVRGFAEKGSVRDLELRLRGKYGNVQTVLVSAEIINVHGRQCILTTSVDITDRKQTEADAQLLTELSERIRLADDAEELQRQTAQMVGEHLQVKRCFFSDVDLANDRGLIRRDYCRDAPSIAGAYRLSDFSQATRDQLLAGHTLINCDAQSDLRTASLYETIYRAAGERAYIRVPLLRDDKLVGIFCVSANEPRLWQPRETALLETIAERVWLAVEKLRLARAVRESEERYRALVRASAQAVWRINEAGMSEEFHTWWQAFTGQSLVEETGLGWLDAVHAEEREQKRALWVHASEHKTPYEMTYRIRRRDGAYRWFTVRGVPVFNADGSFREWIGTLTDVHEREMQERDARFRSDLSEQLRLSEDANELMRAVVQAVGAHLQAARCCFVEVDEAAGRCTIHRDYSRGASMAGVYPLSAFDPEILAWLRAGHALTVSDTMSHPLTAATYEAGFAPFDIRAFIVVPLLRDGRWVSNLVVCSDAVRDWEPREAALLETLAERAWFAVEKLRLAIEREYLLVQAQAARATAEAATRAKDEFIALVSHELRSPLNAILGWNRMLRAQRGADPEIARIAETIERAGRAQLQLVEDLLDTARVISGKLRLNVGPVELNRVIEAALDTLHPAAEARGIALIPLPDPRPVPITGDPDRLQQVVWNLVSNAIKFTPTGGRVTVEVRRAPGGVEIVISDTGRGISAELLPHIFERFRQDDPDAKLRTGGLGLGLALVKHLVELHGGSVRVASPGEGLGATFIVTLPLQTAERAEEQPAPKSSSASPHEPTLPEGTHNLAGLRVLVVDDEAAARDLFCFALGQCGAAVTLADGAASALTVLAAQPSEAPFDILVSDIGMAEMNGYELLRQVRAHSDERIRRLPAVALTAYARTEDRLNALAAGYQMHVAKPVEVEELTAVIASLTGRLG